MNLPADNPGSLNQEPMTGLWVNAGQSIPLSGKYGSKRETAEAFAEATFHSLELRKAVLTKMVREAWYDWAYLKESIATVDTTIRLVDELIVVTRTKYETGGGLQSDLLRLHTERSRLSSRRVELEQKARNSGRRISELLGRKLEQPTSRPQSLPVSFPVTDLERIRVAADNAPQINIARARLKASKSKVTLAKQMWMPELMVGGGYGIRERAPDGSARSDFVSVSLGVTLPLYGGSKQSEAVQEAISQKRAAEHAVRETELAVSRELESLLDEDSRHARQIQLYDEGILPQAEAALSSTLSDYSVGKVGVEALISSERELINAYLQRLMHLRDRAKVRAAIAALIEQDELRTNPQFEER
jgi:outer membrane protein TolC